MRDCPNHKGAFDCAPFCPLCEGNQEIKDTCPTCGDVIENQTCEDCDRCRCHGHLNCELEPTKGIKKMRITDWDNFPLPQIEKLFELVSDTFDDIDEDEALRLALYIWNNETAITTPTPERLEELRSDENDTYQGDQRDEADFAEYWFTEVDEQPVSPNLVIDWAGTYKYALSHDFFSYGIITKTEAEPFSLKRFFWRNY